jgi:dienelactone hydrolase
MRRAHPATYLTTFFLLAAVSAASAGEAVRYSVAGKPYEGWVERAADPRGFVLILHDWDGLTDYEIRRAQMLAELGYDVFAADLFGAGIRPTENRDKRQHTGELYKDRAKMRSLMLGAIDAAAERGVDVSHAVAMGYCFGGAAVLELARSGAPMAAFATFHGGLSTPQGQDHSETQGRLLIYHGSADTAITLEDFAQLGRELEEHGVAHEMTTYSGAPHAFTVFGSDRYQQQADERSWTSFTTHLEAIFGG